MTDSATPNQFSARDIERAVAAGVLTRDTADQLVSFLLPLAENRAEDEQLRLVTGFSDIFVTIGLALFLGALAGLTGGLWILAVPVAAWGLSEIFTRWKRMALPSIVLLFVFGGSVFFAALTVLTPDFATFTLENNGTNVAAAGLLAAIGIALHWWRFRVPVTVAAGAAAAIACCIGLLAAAAPTLFNTLSLPAFVILGLTVFALAMRFDISDLERRTPRTDIAFWLHLLAAPLIVHSLIRGVVDINQLSLVGALAIFSVFLLLALVALVVDRRALLVSSLLYLGYALYTVFSRGDAAWGATLPTFLVGAIVLSLSLAWRAMRGLILKTMPEAVRLRVPAPNSVYFKAKT